MRNIFIFWISILIGVSVKGFCSTNYATMIDSLIKNQNYSAALQITDRLLYFTQDSSRNALIITKSKLLIITNQPYESYQTLSEIINNPNNNRKIISESLIYCAISFIKLEEYHTALFFIETMIFDESWKNTRNLLAAYCYFMIGDAKSTQEQLSYLGINELVVLTNNLKIKQLKRKKSIHTAISFLIPGYAYIINQKYGYGLSALALNGLLFYWVGSTAVLSPLESMLFVLPISMRYYFGTQSRALNIYDKKIKELKNEQFMLFCKQNSSYLK